MTKSKNMPVLDAHALRRTNARGELGDAGLGLAITKALVELYGGTIWVHSAAGKGSTFSLALPITPGMGGDEQASDV